MIIMYEKITKKIINLIQDKVILTGIYNLFLIALISHFLNYFLDFN